MGFNFENAVTYSNAVHSYNHRIEFAADQLFPCEFDEPEKDENNPTANFWPPHKFLNDQNIVNSHHILSTCSSSHAYFVRGIHNTDISQCGWAHYSPNVSWDTEQNEGFHTRNDRGNVLNIEYEGLSRPNLNFRSNCNSWDPNPNHIPVSTPMMTTCATANAWGCIATPENANGTEGDNVRFYKWWMQNLPGTGNNIKRCDGSDIGNFWDYLRGDLPKPIKVNCNPNKPPTPVASLSGVAQAGRIANADITLYTLETGGVLAPIILGTPVKSAADGSYITPLLPATVNGKTLVVQLSGGNFIDEATGQAVSFQGHNLYAVIPIIDFYRPLRAAITPFTDMAFRLTLNALQNNPALDPADQASRFNTRVAALFNLRAQQDENMPFGPTLFNITDIEPLDLYTEGGDASQVAYALALSGLSQQAADTGYSPADWIAQLSTDADDGKLDGIANYSAQSIASAVDEFLAGPRSPFPSTPTPTPTITTTPTATRTPTLTPTATKTPVLRTFTSIAIQDGWVLELSETSNKGGSLNRTAKVLRLGDDSSNRQYRAILSFDTSSLPDTAIISSAVLKLRQSRKPVGVNPFNILGNLWLDVRKGIFSNAATLQLRDFNALTTTVKAGSFSKTPVNGWYSISLNTAGRSSINTTTLSSGLTQLRLYFAIDDNNNHTADFIQFFSSNSLSNKPILTITYMIP